MVDTLYVYRQSAYLVGRDAQVADLVVAHPSCSKQHAVIQFRYTDKKGVMAVRPYVMDLESTNGTFLNGNRIEPSKYIELLVRECFSYRLYCAMLSRVSKFTCRRKTWLNLARVLGNMCCCMINQHKSED